LNYHNEIISKYTGARGEIASLARQYGVSWNMIKKIVDPAYKERQQQWVPKDKVCWCCGTVYNTKSPKYCSRQCSYDVKWIKDKEFFEQYGYWKNCTHERAISSKTRRYLLEKHGNKCSICGLKIWNKNPIPLVMDHKDGNSENHSIDNCRLICCNCDAQLDTYKSRNRGSGREYRRQRYKEGKSY